MATATLSVLVRNVRAEAGHSLAVSQGLNSVDTLKYLIARTEFELWTAFQWPTLAVRAQVVLVPGQYIYNYHPSLTFDQIRETYYLPDGGSAFQVMDYGLPESCIKADGTNSTSGVPKLWEDSSTDNQFRVWPTPSTPGNIRFKGMTPLKPLVNEDDLCTLDPTLIALFTSAELLARAKSEDAASKMQKAQRHLMKLLGQKVSAKHKVSTMGASRRSSSYARLRPGIDYIP
jgi:hypothetical protein